MPRPGQKRKRAQGVRSTPVPGVSASPAPATPAVETNGAGGEEAEGMDEDADADADADADEGPSTKSGQVLPVAILPDDFDGEPEDGATYLALANRANDSLPFYKRVDVPTHLRPTPAPAPAPDAKPSTGRHPALPKESWEVLFAAHFAAYRTHLAGKWPGDILPYPADYPPLPSAGDAPRWLAFINGVPMGRSKAAEEEDMEEDMELDDEAEAEAEALGMAGEEALDEEAAMNDILDEEAAMNDAPPPAPEPLEVLTPREPLVSILQRLSTAAIVRVLKHLTRFTRTALERLEDAMDADAADDPFPPAHARWAFALLTVLDRHLSGDETAVLREFARVAASAAAWRWSAAVARGELVAVPVKLGFYGQGGNDHLGHATGDGAESKTEGEGEGKAMLGEVGGPELAPTGYSVGARWKLVRDARARSDATPRPESEGAGHDAAGLDESLARCWMCAHAVVAGWAQWDLVDDFAQMFRGVPRA